MKRKVRYTDGMDELQYFRENVKAIINESGFTSGNLAERAELSQEHLSRLLSGKHDPTYRVMKRIAKACGVSLLELMAGPLHVAK